MRPGLPVWRSLQYVPAHVEKYVAGAHTRGADAIILDLEDSVPPAEKGGARAGLAAAARQVGQAGADVLVRINGPEPMAAEDIAAAVGPGVAALSIAKAESPDQIRRLDALVTAAERKAGVADGTTGFLLLIESAAAFLQMADIARASPRVVALSMGAEDFAADVGLEPGEDTLQMPRQQVVIAAAAAGVMALGLIGAAVRFDDAEGYLAMARRSRRFGFVGSSCIHPSQIPLLNQAFSPTEDEIERARVVVAAAEAAEREGRGAFALNGKMIDAPVVAQAERALARHRAISARQERLKAWSSVSAAGP
jgi:citrate lyase subunit beta/citryl-CoA lyase